MPPRTQPKIYLLQIKTHKLSVHVVLPPTATLAELKQEAYDALTSDVAEPLTRLPDSEMDPNSMDEDYDDFNPTMDTGLPRTAADVVPCVSSLEDFELCRAIKEKGKMTGEFHVVEANDIELKLSGFSGWEVLFVQFRNKKSGLLMPAKFTLPPIDDDDDDETLPQPRSSNTAESSNAGIGKRKAREQD